MGTSACVSSMFVKRNNICDILFTSVGNKILPVRHLSVRGKNSFLKDVKPYEKGGKNNLNCFPFPFNLMCSCILCY